jgi:hypothetical protein
MTPLLPPLLQASRPASRALLASQSEGGNPGATGEAGRSGPFSLDDPAYAFPDPTSGPNHEAEPRAPQTGPAPGGWEAKPGGGRLGWRCSLVPAASSQDDSVSPRGCAVPAHWYYLTGLRSACSLVLPHGAAQCLLTGTTSRGCAVPAHWYYLTGLRNACSLVLPAPSVARLVDLCTTTAAASGVCAHISPAAILDSASYSSDPQPLTMHRPRTSLQAAATTTP